MKKFIVGFLIGCILTLTIPAYAENAKINLNKVRLLINGKLVDQPTILYNNNTYVPLRVVSESLGLNVNWDANAKTVSISDGKNNSDKVPQAAIQPDDLSWLKEVNKVEWGGKSYPKGLVVTKEDKFYLNMKMVLDHYPDAKPNLQEMNSVNYNNEQYVLLPELKRYFKAYGINCSYRLFSSKPPSPDESIPGDPEWLKEVGFVIWGGKPYPAAVVVAKDGSFYWTQTMLVEQYPQIATELGSMETKEYNGKLFISMTEVMDFIKSNGLPCSYRMSTSTPPKN